MQHAKVTHMSMDDIIKDPKVCPFPIEIFPNQMGINLVAIDSISWQRLPDGQLTNISINFKAVLSDFG
jgi:hypothetical protein